MHFDENQFAWSEANTVGLLSLSQAHIDSLKLHTGLHGQTPQEIVIIQYNTSQFNVANSNTFSNV